MKKTLLAIGSSAAIIVGVVSVATADAHGRSAKARLATAAGVKVGTVEFATDHGHTEVRVRLSAGSGLDAFHGFHIHANDDPANGDGCTADPNALSSTWFVSADGHYNPTAQGHAHHVGDMPSLYVNADGSTEARFRLDQIDPSELAGKVVVLHAGADNFANVPTGASANQYTPNSADATTATGKTGNAGDRIACGVITSR